jgi:hypothetical protein
MFRFGDPSIMRVDGEEQPTKVVSTQSTDTSKITDAEVKAASIAAARELAMTPYTELTPAERKSMTQKEKTDYIQAAREEQARLDAEERAASNPMFDFNNRPEAPTKPDMIQYYSWIGDVNTGSWKLYSAPNTLANQAKYGGRSTGGETQATSDSPVGANSLINPPVWDAASSTWKPAGFTPVPVTSITSKSLFPNDPTDLIAMLNRLNELSTKSRSGIAGIGPDAGKVFTGKLTPEEIAEYDRIYANVQIELKTGRPVYSIANPDGTRTFSYTNPDGIATQVSGTSFTPTNNSTTSVTSTALTGLNAETTALIKSLQDQIANLTKQVTNTSTTTTLEEKQRKENALASLTSRFSKYGLESLIPKIKDLVIKGSTEATIALELAETEEYKQRFKANTERLKKGLSVLDPGTYIGLEDSYRQALRAYGLKQFDTDDYVSQFIANDISANELSNRIVTAVQRVQNADPAITKQLRDFYNIGQNDLVAYVLDPNQQFQKIERQVQAAEIGVAAARQGITAGVQVAEQLAAQGVTQAEAQKGYATIADILPDAKKLSDIYGTTLEGYDLGQAEQEVFNQLASAQRRRQKLTQREIAAFGGSSGTNKTSLTTSAVGQF